jgi:hypothetical protein
MGLSVLALMKAVKTKGRTCEGFGLLFFLQPELFGVCLGIIPTPDYFGSVSGQLDPMIGITKLACWVRVR